MEPSTEQRQFQRVHFFQRVQVSDNLHTQETHCLDISLRGILLVVPENTQWSLEQQVKVVLQLTEDESITMMCSVTHIDDDVVGCACDSMDLDSLTTLRRLLEYNLQDPAEVNRELGELIRQR